jgi:hypothetical protein
LQYLLFHEHILYKHDTNVIPFGPTIVDEINFSAILCQSEVMSAAGFAATAGGGGGE